MITTTKAKSNRLFWLTFMSKSRKRRSSIDWKRAETLARNWDTCACGSINDGLPRHTENNTPAPLDMPLDNELASLGGKFYRTILDKRLSAARTLFNEIQFRAAQVLNKSFELENWK